MLIGVPREIKSDEYRVAMLPVGVEELSRAGHTVLMQREAGKGSGITDDQNRENGAEIVATAKEIFDRADLVVKVKEPMPDEWTMLRPKQTVFTYFHFTANFAPTTAMIDFGDAGL